MCPKRVCRSIGKSCVEVYSKACGFPSEEVFMRRSRLRINMIRAGISVLIAGAACTATPVVKSTCVISWDRSLDWRIDHYKVSVWQDGKSEKPPYIVKAPATEVSCQAVGVQGKGGWQATIQACLKDGTCSEPSTPKPFKVLE